MPFWPFFAVHQPSVNHNNLGYEIMKYDLSTLSRVSTGLSAFCAAGLLMVAILTENGGIDNHQGQWRDASSRTVAIDPGRINVASTPQEDSTPWLDNTVTGSIRNIGDEAQKNDELPEPPKAQKEELSVLALIRKNSDVVPSVSSGTDRVSVTVEKGDTLFAIARRHGLTVPQLAALNNIAEPYDNIRIGQTLYVAR